MVLPVVRNGAEDEICSHRPDLVHVHLNAILVLVSIRAYSASASALATLLLEKGMRIFRCEPDEKPASLMSMEGISTCHDDSNCLIHAS